MNTIEKKSVNVGNYISKNEMDTLTTAYKQQRWADNSSRLGRADSMSVWLTVEELEGFLDRVKENGGNGVRLHFAVHTEGYHIPEQVGMQTVVMVANRSKDGSLENAKQILTSGEVIAYLPAPICPPMCGGGFGGKTSGMGQATLIVRDDNSMEVI
ncbi:MAG: hypothetical protein JST68_09545 [Bacteroidetes bacterium]|nr:hypothetical protein [Bacteroidota bacterium]